MSADSYKLAKMPLHEAFPDCPAPLEPFGGRVLVQIMRTSNKTDSGIFLVENTKDTVKWNMQVAKVISLGPLAFKNRQTAEAWPEGAWAKVGDYVRVPRWDGDRTEVQVKGSNDPIVFALFNDTQLLGRIVGDPCEQPIYEL